jgi:hypothetical protein
MLDSELLNYIIKAFQLIKKGPFRRILTYLRPSLSDKDIPHRQTLHNEIINKANLSEARLKETTQGETDCLLYKNKYSFRC